MLYTNRLFKVERHQIRSGDVRGIAIGQFGRGNRRKVIMPVGRGIEEIEGFCEDFTICFSGSGRPRIKVMKDERLYVILSSERGYTRMGCGCIMVPKDQEKEIIVRGRGADGDAGRVGTWDAIVSRAYDGDIFRVVWGGYKNGYPSTFYVVFDGKVYAADQPNVKALYDSLGIEMPFRLPFNEIVSSEWKTI